mgnify:CR=1 FL=1
MEENPEGEKPNRRDFFTGTAAAAGLAAGYGTFGWMAGRFLYPTHSKRTAWMLLRPVGEIADGHTLSYTAPTGATITIARRGTTGTETDFLALSDTCPHLGCKVRWEGPQNRFFCPCHNGVFTPEGKAVSGPPAEAGQSLMRYPLRIEEGLLYIEVPV